MHKNLAPIAVLAMALSIASSATAALVAAPTAHAAQKTTTLTAHQVAPHATWLGAADITTAAFRVSDGGPAITRTDAGRVTTVPSPDGCQAVAAGGGRIASVCGDDRRPNGPGAWDLRHLAVTDLAGGEVVSRDQTIAVPSTNVLPDDPVAVGAQWIASPWPLMPDEVRNVYVNWRTGEQRILVPSGPDPIDLDAPDLSTPLCAPLKAASAPKSGPDPVPTYPVTANGRWVLITTSLAPERSTLHRCGTAGPVAVPAGFAAPILGDGWLAERHSDGTHLLRLSDRRRLRVPGFMGELALHFTKGRLYATTGDGRLLTVRLPAHQRR
jgi:hypothetical protein